MGCKCGSQIILCNLPVRFDTYRGCSHGCRYCFAQKKNDIIRVEMRIKPGKNVDQLTIIGELEKLPWVLEVNE
mgnify:CR=1 FL=1